MEQIFERKTKSAQVKNHLIKEGFIDSWTAITLYGATRLSAIIYNLRRRGFVIDSQVVATKDRNNNLCQFVKYIFVKQETN
jgi:ribosomal protein S8